MKKTVHTSRLTVVIFCCLFFGTAKAQFVTIPDTNFVNFLTSSGYALCMNGDQLDTTCLTVVNTTALNCSARGIVDLTGVQYFRRLDSLICRSNLLTNLPPLPDSLTSIDCSDNVITTLPALPPNLRTLVCGNGTSFAQSGAATGNKLTSLPALPNSLAILQVDNSNLTTFPSTAGMMQLYRVSCSNNPITSFGAFGDTILELDITNNLATSLPAWPKWLYHIYCFSDSTRLLPDLPPAVNEIDCGGPNLGALPALNPGLFKLSCFQASITSVPTLYPGLVELDCELCGRATSISPLPTTLQVLNLEMDTNLTCLPALPTLYDLYLFQTGVQCVPNYCEVILTSEPLITSFPLCTPLNGCPLDWNINGSVYFDANSDCIHQNSEPTLYPVKMNLYQDGTLLQQAIFPGVYSFKTNGLGNYTVSVDTNDLPFQVTCPNGDSTVSVSASDSLVTNVNFEAVCGNGFDLGVGGIAGRFVPGKLSIVNIGAGDISNHYNVHCAVGVAGTVTATFSGPVSYFSPASAALTPSTITADSVVWQIADFDSTNFESSFNLILRCDSSATIGDEICITVSVSPVGGGDNNLSNNIGSQCSHVRSSFDPNFKDETSPSRAYVDTSNGWLTYTIYFQNTGTDTAVNIVIIDTLDDNVDPNTFEFLQSSSKSVVQVQYKIVQFNFPSIRLPDSSINKSGSVGFVQYRVKIKAGTLPGAQILNTGHINFDLNVPVVTNTDTNTIGTIATNTSALFSYEPRLSVFPNPANDKLYISAIGFRPDEIRIYDINGKKLSEQKFEPQIDIHALPAGIYLIEVSGVNNVLRNKVVKINEE